MFTGGSFTVRPIAAQDYAEWSDLYAAYAAFYAVRQTQAMRHQVWQWLQSPQPSMYGLLALDAQCKVIGFLHYRTFIRPLAASTGGYVDDLFVAADARGMGVAQQLLHTVTEIGREQGWSVVRWMTASDNRQARLLYDKIARHTHWQTYEITLDVTDALAAQG